MTATRKPKGKPATKPVRGNFRQVAEKVAKDELAESPELLRAIEDVPGAMVADLSPKQRIFVHEYLVDLNGSRAARAAGYSPVSAYVGACDLLGNPKVKSAIAVAIRARQMRLGITGDDVVARLWTIASADPRELVQHVRGSCRHCWGIGGRMQRTDAEMERDRAEHIKLQDMGKADGDFDEQGGTGYNFNREPNPECSECFGHGRTKTLIADTRTLSPAAQALYAGVKQSKDGIEVKMHSQLDALVRVGMHMGLFTEKLIVSGKVKHEHTAIDELRAFLESRTSRLPIATEVIENGAAG